jgi:hypothetical protein
MKKYFGNYVGVVINNNDPEFRGRVQVFVPHIMPTLYENWNKEGEDITFTCVGDNMPQGLNSTIVEKLKKILPWSEAASPIIGQCSPGNVLESSPVSLGSGGQIMSTSPKQTSSLDQSPTCIPDGSFDSNSKLKILGTNNVDSEGLKPGFTQRLNAFYEEATKLGYLISSVGAFRSTEKQIDFHDELKGSSLPPESSAHELGLAIDLSITGPGVSITSFYSESSRNGVNYDTIQFRNLLKKYLLHQPFHPETSSAAFPEHWHIEPIECPAAGSKRTFEIFAEIGKKLQKTVRTGVVETTSSSQFPAAANPLSVPNPGETSTTYSQIPTTL